ncbi:hypothetical protein IGK47_003575 [Enterococcus sp. AZ007]
MFLKLIKIHSKKVSIIELSQALSYEQLSVLRTIDDDKEFDSSFLGLRLPEILVPLAVNVGSNSERSSDYLRGVFKNISTLRYSIVGIHTYRMTTIQNYLQNED